MSLIKTAQIVRGGGAGASKNRGRSFGRLAAGAVAVALVGGVLAVSPVSAASAASGGGSVPGSGGTVGNFRPFGWMFDGRTAGNQGPAQGFDQASVDWFFAHNPNGVPVSTASEK